MEREFIETRYDGEMDLPKDLISELPSKIMVATTVQYLSQLPEIKRKLSAYDKEVSLFRSMHGQYAGQILGCDNFKISFDADCFLYVGDGEFHPTALLVNEKPVFVYSPLSEKWKKLGRKEREEIELRKKVALMKFHSGDKVGILISVKEGQHLIQGKVAELKKKLEAEGKEVYLFLSNEIKDLENFNFIDCWVNTACPRISEDVRGMINLRDLK
ncbi:2-(3-amino-3-carboxypropyl)histidine synthase [Candidatus Woesearchaeota archaeon]|nr:2-(3-amino-3-carboxypropyl)histidine synthase [Candidatus Woesearchaeota archaeon]